MSSYNFNRANDAQGPPSDSNGNTNNVPINAYVNTFNRLFHLLNVFFSSK
jgi:hypothetical protein